RLERERVAINQRKLFDRSLLYDQADRSRGRLQLLDAGGDFDDLGGAADLKGNVLLIRLIDVDHGMGVFDLFETRTIDGQRVGTGIKVGKIVDAVVVGNRGLHHTGRFIAKNHFGLGKNGSSIVSYLT